MFRIKFPTKRIFLTFPILRTGGMAQFCNLFMERPSYYMSCWVREKIRSNKLALVYLA